MNIQPIKKVLHSLAATIQPLSNDEYTRPINALSHATIGEHTRHIIELFQCLTSAYSKGVLNYDDRERNQLMQNNVAIAVQQLEALSLNIEQKNKCLALTNSLSDSREIIETNYYRELLYNFEHCIHHQALIKVGLLSLNKMPDSEDFGIAPSTLAYKKVCAQ